MAEVNHCAPTATVFTSPTPSYVPEGIGLCEKNPYFEVNALAPAPSIGTNLIATEDANSTTAPVGKPATTKIASTFPFLNASVAALPFKASALTSPVLNPLDSKINLAST